MGPKDHIIRRILPTMISAIPEPEYQTLLFISYRYYILSYHTIIYYTVLYPTIDHLGSLIVLWSRSRRSLTPPSSGKPGPPSRREAQGATGPAGATVGTSSRAPCFFWFMARWYRYMVYGIEYVGVSKN